MLRSIGSRFRRLLNIGAPILLLATASAAHAQAYPNKPLRWIVPYPAGGGVDFITRTVAQKMSAQLGQTIVIDNRPGAAGMIGMEAAARSAGDGYTLVTGENGSLAINPNLYKKIPYDPVNDFKPVSLFARVPFMLSVNPSVVPVANFNEFVAYVRSRPGQVSYASFGTGSIAHMMMELMKSKTGLNLTHVPYKGAAPAVQDLLGGQIGTMFADYITAKSHVSSGKVRPLAVSSKARHPSLPDLPSMQESGVRDYDVYSWMGLMVPASTPAAIVERLKKELQEAMASPQVLAAFEERGILPAATSEQEFARLLKEETAQWAEIVRSAKIQLD